MAMHERPKRIWFTLRQNLRLLLSLFGSKPHVIIIFHLKTYTQKLENYHVNGSQTRTHFVNDDPGLTLTYFTTISILEKRVFVLIVGPDVR